MADVEEAAIGRVREIFIFRNPVMVIGVLGALVRLGFLLSSSNDASFWHPLVDEKTYHDLALGYSTTGWTDRFLWQAAFYPAFLTFIYETLGSSGLAAKIIQAGIGGLSCALTAQLGKEVGGVRTGVIAGLIMVFYGPVMFFESRLLATGWGIFWVALLGVLLVRLDRKAPWFMFLLTGSILALAVYTRPVFLVAIPLFGVTILVSRHIGRNLNTRMMRLAVVLIGFAVVAVPVSLVFKNLTGHLGLVPPSGGINLYIGNHADYDRTINIRPGTEWAKLVSEPIKAGRDPNPWAGDPFFRDRALALASHQPGRATGLLFEKLLTLLSSREIPRNLDIYLHREWSPVLSLVTWRAGGWGFPFGMLFPLAMVGVGYARSREAVLVKLLAASLGMVTVVVIVSARYKVLLIPLLAVLAAAGIVEIARLFKDKDRLRLLPISVVMVVSVLVSTWPGPFAPEKVDLRAEYYFGIGHDLYDQEEWAGAAEYMAKSIALDPDVHRSRQVMGIASARLQRDDDAVLHFREAIRLRPGHRATEANLATALRERAQKSMAAGMEIEQEDPAAALALYRKSAGDQPGWYEPWAREALVLATTRVDSLRDGPRAVDLAQRALRLRREMDPRLTYILVCALAECGRFAEALEVAKQEREVLVGGADVVMLSRFEKAIGKIEAGEAVDVGDFLTTW